MVIFINIHKTDNVRNKLSKIYFYFFQSDLKHKDKKTQWYTKLLCIESRRLKIKSKYFYLLQFGPHNVLLLVFETLLLLGYHPKWARKTKSNKIQVQGHTKRSGTSGSSKSGGETSKARHKPNVAESPAPKKLRHKRSAKFENTMGYTSKFQDILDYTIKHNLLPTSHYVLSPSPQKRTDWLKVYLGNGWAKHSVSQHYGGRGMWISASSKLTWSI